MITVRLWQTSLEGVFQLSLFTGWFSLVGGKLVEFQCITQPPLAWQQCSVAPHRLNNGTSSVTEE